MSSLFWVTSLLLFGVDEVGVWEEDGLELFVPFFSQSFIGLESPSILESDLFTGLIFAPNLVGNFLVNSESAELAADRNMDPLLAGLLMDSSKVFR